MHGKGQQAAIIIQVTKKELRDKIAEMNAEIGGWDKGFDPFYGAPAMHGRHVCKGIYDPILHTFVHCF